MDKLHKQPRLFLPDTFSANTEIPISSDKAHYLKNVMRLGENAKIRAFNGHDGEWLIELSELSKKKGTGLCLYQIREQPPSPPSIHLYFAPIKKNRLDFLIEKAVELGVTDLHPVITEHTEVRKLNNERIEAQIIESAEQCERLDIPTLHFLTPLPDILSDWVNDSSLLAAVERDNTALPLHEIDKTCPVSALIGPEGGFSDNEIQLLKNHLCVQAISLGQNILRAETAALKILSYIGD